MLPSRRFQTIHALADDVVLMIISFIEVKDILSLRQTSKKFYSLTKLRWVWTNAVKRHVIDKGLPVPASSSGLKAFSSGHLEARAVHAAKLHDNWYSKHPKPRRAVEFSLDRIEGDERPPAVNQVLFLTGRSGEFIVTLAGGVITAWEVPLDGSGAYRIAEWMHDNAVEQIVVNQDPGHDVELAYRSPDRGNPDMVWIYTLSLDTFHGCFKPRAAVRAYRSQVVPLHVMHGDYIAMGDPLILWYTDGRAEGKGILKFMTDPTGSESNKILAVKFIGGHILVIRQLEFQLFVMPTWSREHVAFKNPCTLAASLHWENPASEAVIVSRISPHPDVLPLSNAWPEEAVTILVRETVDGFNTIRQYDFLPNLEKKVIPGHAITLPCILPSTYTHILPVVPSSCKLTAGRSGKGFWIQTDNAESKHNKFPARCLIGFDVVGPKMASKESPSTPSDADTRHESRSTSNDLHLCEGKIYARRCDMSEVIRKTYSLRAADIEDVVGRIAVGDKTGKIEVLDYV
ncbi:hypothetical protein PHLGIDRAFT_63566 [Phlebiopsis gigantea 11061_1 CR5-6]|uniref:F-box domain-containing protein n=1 Tax=Phlebiopsis gigantea (strain 11061_1 CR5-6) TaxID=745531 RepID=A0A0C3S601_PHLG1|nr:hypothetical protein PHLGIDRAFT_63566 [Phlebiopsis gigantea 11061_1 CR5-6]